MGVVRYLVNLLRSAFAIGVTVGAVLFAVSYPFNVAEPNELAVAVIVILSVVTLTAVIWRLRLVLWSVTTFVAYLAGLIYAAEILLMPDVNGGYRAAVLTVAVFSAHGLVIGAFLELVSYLHRVSERAVTFLKEKTRLKIE
jgi:hypothetical protein